MFSDVADASEAYEKVDVSAPAILGGQVTFTITMQKNCSHPFSWQFTFRNATEVFYDDGNTIIIRKDKNTYTLTLMNATSNYHKSNITFICDQIPIDTVTLDLIGKSIFQNVCTRVLVYSTTKKVNTVYRFSKSYVAVSIGEAVYHKLHHICI